MQIFNKKSFENLHGNRNIIYLCSNNS